MPSGEMDIQKRRTDSSAGAVFALRCKQQRYAFLCDRIVYKASADSILMAHFDTIINCARLLWWHLRVIFILPNNHEFIYGSELRKNSFR